MKLILLYNNEIIRLPKNVFDGLFNLTIINFDHNKIKYLDENIFKGLEKVTEIRFAYNKIEKLPKGIFKGLNKLKSITLDSNQITKIDKFTFNDLENLERIHLASNLISEERIELDFQDCVKFVSFKDNWSINNIDSIIRSVITTNYSNLKIIFNYLKKRKI